MGAILDLLNIRPEVIYVFMLAFARIYTFWSFLPLVSGDAIPSQAKVMICLGITPFAAIPMINDGVRISLEAPVALLLVKEAALGAVIGLMVGLPLRIPEMVGDIIDNQRGAAVTDSFNPSSGENVSMLGQLLSLSIVVYFFTEQGFERLIRVVIATFKLTPVDSFTVKFEGSDVWETLFGLFIDYLTLFAILALPVMIAMFMAEMALALASRFASSLNVFSLAQPVKALLATSIIITIFPKILDSILKLTDQTIRFFGG